MSNIKISQLPNWIGGNTTGSFIVMNDSGSNTTYKIRKEQWLFPYSGNASISGSLNVTGSVNISSVMKLANQNPLPTGTTGSLAVSGSGLYFHNGTSWNLIS
jgi:hypothetical protein